MLRVALLLFATSQVFAEGRIEVAEHEPIVISAAAETPEGDGWTPLYDWYVRDAGVSLREVDDGRTAHLWAEPNPTDRDYEVEFRVRWVRVGDAGALDVRKSSQVYRLFVAGKDRPKPDPKPPTPPQPPNPTAPAAWVIVLRDLETDTPEEAASILELRTSDRLARGPPELAVLDVTAQTPDDQPDPVAVGWSKRKPAGAGFPYVFVVDDAGRVLHEMELTKAADVLGVLK